MDDDPYSAAVRALFANPLHAGDPQARYPRVARGEASESDAGCAVALTAELDGRVLRRLRYRVFGCPHLIAAAESICGRYEGRTADSLSDLPVKALMDELGVPVEKTGRILLLEDAARELERSCARLPGGEPHHDQAGLKGRREQTDGDNDRRT